MAFTVTLAKAPLAGSNRQLFLDTAKVFRTVLLQLIQSFPFLAHQNRWDKD